MTIKVTIKWTHWHSSIIYSLIFPNPDSSIFSTVKILRHTVSPASGVLNDYNTDWSIYMQLFPTYNVDIFLKFKIIFLLSILTSEII